VHRVGKEGIVRQPVGQGADRLAMGQDAVTLPNDKGGPAREAAGKGIEPIELWRRVCGCAIGAGSGGGGEPQRIAARRLAAGRQIGGIGIERRRKGDKKLAADPAPVMFASPAAVC
jgi:hypothetical protein